MKKFSLGSLLSRDELNIIDEQNIHFSKFISEFIHLLIADGVDELIGKLFRREVTDFFYIRKDPVLQDLVSDGVKEMGLAQPHAAINKKRVIILRGQIGDGQTGRIGELVAGTNDEVFKRIFGIEERLGKRKLRGLVSFLRVGEEIFAGRLFIFDPKYKDAMLLGETADRLLNLRGIMLVDPLFKKAIRHLHLQPLACH